MLKNGGLTLKSVPFCNQILEGVTPKAVRPAQGLNFQSDFPGYDVEYIFGP